MDRDPYDILGVDRSASEAELRAAYRKLARTYHPDVCSEDDALEKFGQVQEAWEILSDPEKKAMFDQYGRVATPSGGASGGAGGVQMDPERFSEIFEEMFGGGGGGGQNPFGGGFRGSAGQASPRRGADARKEVHVTFLTAARGGVEDVKLDNGRRVKVRIPAGVDDGGTLRMRGKGGPGLDGGEAGDMLVTIRVGAHPLFVRQGLDLLVDVPISIAEAALGAAVEVRLLQGRVKVRIPAGTSSGKRLRVKGQGINAGPDRVGDFYAVVQIVAPAELDDESRDAIESIGKTLPDPRQDIDGLDTVEP